MRTIADLCADADAVLEHARAVLERSTYTPDVEQALMARFFEETGKGALQYWSDYLEWLTTHDQS